MGLSQIGSHNSEQREKRLTSVGDGLRDGACTRPSRQASQTTSWDCRSLSVLPTTAKKPWMNTKHVAVMAKARVLLLNSILRAMAITQTVTIQSAKITLKATPMLMPSINIAAPMIIPAGDCRSLSVLPTTAKKPWMNTKHVAVMAKARVLLLNSILRAMAITQ
nr:hypothetical protein Iba_chr05cCG3970 [Ipomoea batatas]